MCDPQNIYIHNDAVLGARNQFGLNTKTELLTFIGNQGLQNLKYLNTEPWRLKPERIKGDVFIDAYNFYSNQKIGYIAFMKGANCKYAIKSFHWDHDKFTTKNLGANTTKLLKDEI